MLEILNRHFAKHQPSFPARSTPHWAHPSTSTLSSLALFIVSNLKCQQSTAWCCKQCLNHVKQSLSSFMIIQPPNLSTTISALVCIFIPPLVHAILLTLQCLICDLVIACSRTPRIVISSWMSGSKVVRSLCLTKWKPFRCLFSLILTYLLLPLDMRAH